MLIEGHSNELVLLVLGCAIFIGLYGYLHARRYWEGLPPMLDGFLSMLGFLMVIGAFLAGGRIGNLAGHPHAGRVLAVLIALITYRMLRTWLGREQERYRKLRVRKTEGD
jgi:hypothetical protein